MGFRDDRRRTIGLLLAAVLVVLPLLLAAGTANAQALLVILFGDALSTEKFQLGINADVVWSGYNEDGSSRFSWAFGAYGEIKLNDRWHLQPELTIKTPGGGSQLSIATPGPFSEATGDSTLDAIQGDSELARQTNYITIPVMIKYLAGRFAFGVGPQIGFLTGSTDIASSRVERGDLELREGSKDYVENFDAGIVASVSYALKPQAKMRSVRIDLKGYYGLTEATTSASGASMNNWMIFLGLDIPVGGKDAAADADTEEE